VEKDNGIPSLVRRASGHEKRGRFEQCHSLRGSSWLEKKVPGKLKRFVSEKMKENERWSDQ
jgi:hypothetical protein